MPLTLSNYLHLLTVPLLIGLERTAFYGARSLLVLWMVDVLELPQADSFSAYSTMSMGLVLGPLLGAWVVVALGPYWSGLIGAFVCVAGVGLLAPAEGAWWMAGLGTLVVGQSILRPALWTLLAVQLVAPRDRGRVALFAFAYLAVNLGATLGSFGAATSDLYGFSLVFACSSALFALVALAFPVLWAAGRSDRWPEPSLSDSLPITGIGVLVLLLAAPFWGLVSVAGSASYQTIGPVDAVQLQYVNLVGVMGMASLLALVMTGLQIAGRRLPTLVLAGVALLAAAFGATAVAPTVTASVGLAGIGVSALAIAVTEGVAMPVAMARSFGDTHWRVVPLLFALWTAATAIPSMGADTLAAAAGLDLAIAISAMVVAVTGLGLLLIGVLVRETDAEALQDAPEGRSR